MRSMTDWETCSPSRVVTGLPGMMRSKMKSSSTTPTSTTSMPASLFKKLLNFKTPSS